MQDTHEGSLGAFRPRQIAAWRRAGRALRASDWWYLAPLPLVGLVSDPQRAEHVILRVLGGVFVAAFCLGYAYGLNGITDRDMDRDEAKNSLAGHAGFPREAAVLVAACAIGAMVIAAMLTPVALLGASVSLVAATFYSAYLRLKRLPVVGTLVNVLIFAPLPLLAVAHRPTVSVEFLTYCFWVLVTQNQIIHEVADAREDASGGVRTTGVVVGPMGLRAIALMLGPLGILPLWWMPVGPAALYCAVVGLCTGAALVALCDPQRAGRLRVTHRWFSFAVGVGLFALIARAGA